jgi:small nuclear ribonucleoprotein (snRNP)-like protein
VLQLPLGLLNAAQGHPMLVELKNGETLNGHLVLCDTWMNLTLREVVQTSPVSGDNTDVDPRETLDTDRIC